MTAAREHEASIHFRLPVDLAGALRQRAEDNGRTLSGELRWLVRGAIERSEPGGRHCRAAAGRAKR
jgi:hypothetical protein